MKNLNANELVALEQMIDRTSLATVLVAIRDICGEKADHLRTNWQDERTAKVWERAGNNVTNASTAASVRAVSAD